MGTSDRKYQNFNTFFYNIIGDKLHIHLIFKSLQTQRWRGICAEYGPMAWDVLQCLAHIKIFTILCDGTDAYTK